MVLEVDVATSTSLVFGFSRGWGLERGFLEPVHGGKGTNLLFSNGLTVSSHGYSREPDGLPTRI